MEISRKEFLKLSPIIVFFPFILLNSINCSSRDFTTNPQEKTNSELFNSLVLNQPNFLVESTSPKKGDGYLIPISSINFGSRENGYVVCLRNQGNYPKLQSIEVKILEKSEDFALVSNIQVGDILLKDQRKSLYDLGKANLQELKKRFLPLLPLPN